VESYDGMTIEQLQVRGHSVCPSAFFLFSSIFFPVMPCFYTVGVLDTFRWLLIPFARAAIDACVILRLWCWV